MEGWPRLLTIFAVCCGLNAQEYYGNDVQYEYVYPTDVQLYSDPVGQESYVPEVVIDNKKYVSSSQELDRRQNLLLQALFGDLPFQLEANPSQLFPYLQLPAVSGPYLPEGGVQEFTVHIETNQQPNKRDFFQGQGQRQSQGQGRRRSNQGQGQGQRQRDDGGQGQGQGQGGSYDDYVRGSRRANHMPKYALAYKGARQLREYKKKTKKVKDKIIYRRQRFGLAGGTKTPGLFRTLKSCENACNKTPQCLAGDWNKETYECFFHNRNACKAPIPHPHTTHFSKIPCPNDLLLEDHLNVVINFNRGVADGVLFKGIKDIQTCIKKCMNLGGGIARDTSEDGTISLDDIISTPQVCFAIDFDFGKHQCYMTLRTVFYDEHDHLQSFCTDAHATDHEPDSGVPFVDRDGVVNYFFCPSDAEH